jgi:hypothetical protein
MFEFLKHFFGFCGEHWHPSVLTMLLGMTGVRPAYVYIRSRLTRNKR